MRGLKEHKARHSLWMIEREAEGDWASGRDTANDGRGKSEMIEQGPQIVGE